MSRDPVRFRFTEKTGMVLLNPTNEDLDMQYAGVSFTMKPGEKGDFEANAANHLLNVYGPRGLSYLKFGADENAVAEDGRKRNYEFRKRMVTEFNFRNESRKIQGLGYHVPSEAVRKYAKELDLTLMEPYAAKDEEMEKIRSQEQMIANLQASIAALTEQMKSMAAAKAKPEAKEETKEPYVRHKPKTLHPGDV